MIELIGRAIKEGRAEGIALVSEEPISFYGGVDPETGKIIERGHPLYGSAVSGRILVFPHGKGSTVGSYILLRLKMRGLAPLAIINERCEPIIAVGVTIAEIPAVDHIDISKIPQGSRVRVDGRRVIIYPLNPVNSYHWR